jgi:hypothetical protein
MEAAVVESSRVNLDVESRAIIFMGASVNQLGAIFRTKPDRIQRLLGDLRSVGTGRQGNPLYDLAEAAARIVPPEITPEAIDNYMRHVNHAHLPAMISKHYWDGKRARDRYLETVNELWFTDDIVRVASDSFQTLRTQLMLVPDRLRADGRLNDEQFRAVQRTIDDQIEELGARLVTALGKPGRDPLGPGSEDQDEGDIPIC